MFVPDLKPTFYGAVSLKNQPAYPSPQKPPEVQDHLPTVRQTYCGGQTRIDVYFPHSFNQKEDRDATLGPLKMAENLKKGNSPLAVVLKHLPASESPGTCVKTQTAETAGLG